VELPRTISDQAMAAVSLSLAAVTFAPVGRPIAPRTALRMSPLLADAATSCIAVGDPLPYVEVEVATTVSDEGLSGEMKPITDILGCVRSALDPSALLSADKRLLVIALSLCCLLINGCW
jgi:hypothetical protein